MTRLDSLFEPAVSGFLVAQAWKGAALLVAALLAVVALRRAGAAMRHQAWAAVFAAVLALPALHWAVPELLPAAEEPAMRVSADAPANPAVRTQAGPASAKAPADGGDPLSREPVDRAVPHGLEAVGAGWPLGPMLIAVWLIVAAALLGDIAFGLLGLVRLRAAMRPLDDPGWEATGVATAAHRRIRRRVRLFTSTRVDVPVTWGLVRPVVVLPDCACDWDAGRRRVVFEHELAHVRRGDFATMLLARAAVALHWFNPLAWWGLRRMAADAERACDDAVVSAGVAPGDYAGHLVALAQTLGGRRLRTAPAIAMARGPEVSGRVEALLDGRERTSHPAPARGAVVVLTSLALAGMLAAAERAEVAARWSPHAAVAHLGDMGRVALTGIGERDMAERDGEAWWYPDGTRRSGTMAPWSAIEERAHSLRPARDDGLQSTRGAVPSDARWRRMRLEFDIDELEAPQIRVQTGLDRVGAGGIVHHEPHVVQLSVLLPKPGALSAGEPRLDLLVAAGPWTQRAVIDGFRIHAQGDTILGVSPHDSGNLLLRHNLDPHTTAFRITARLNDGSAVRGRVVREYYSQRNDSGRTRSELQFALPEGVAPGDIRHFVVETGPWTGVSFSGFALAPDAQADVRVADVAPTPPASFRPANQQEMETAAKAAGVLFKMLANANDREFYPTLDPDGPPLTADIDAEVLREIAGDDAVANMADDIAALLTGDSEPRMLYFGQTVPSEAHALALMEHYDAVREHVRKASRTDQRVDLTVPMASEPHELDPDSAHMYDTSEGTMRSMQLREGIERFFITDINNPAAGAQAQSKLPVLWELPDPAAEKGMVLYMDGHIEWVPVGEFPLTERMNEAARQLVGRR
jgi:beta-lactamase regulating signal transducer with metallopeptidase domain